MLQILLVSKCLYRDLIVIRECFQLLHFTNSEFNGFIYSEWLYCDLIVILGLLSISSH
jgi:hypothetical protein